MKKLLLILALIPLFAMGQKEHVVKEYCMVYHWKLSNARIITENGDSIISDKNGEKIKFKTTPAILNYMSKEGWELHSVINRENGVFESMILYRIKKEERE
jgi:hypothetical protein